MLLAEALKLHPTDVLDHLDRQADIPRIDRSFCPGDGSILRVTTKAATTPIPREGVVFLGVGAPGQQTGHPHALHGNGFFDFARTSDITLIGTLTVPEGETVLVSHPEHGYGEVLPGTYRVGRQRDYAGEWRQVAD